MNSVNRVNTREPNVDAALGAMRHGNGPRKVAENVLEGTQKLPDLAKSVMNYYGAKRFDGWEEWLEPALEALESLSPEEDAAEEGAA